MYHYLTRKVIALHSKKRSDVLTIVAYTNILYTTKCFSQVMTVEAIRQGGFLISKIHQLQGRIFSRKLKEVGLSEINSAQGRILFVLWQQDNIAMNELARRTALEKSTLTRMLDRLEDAGLVARVAAEEDRRKVLVRLTSESREMKNKYQQVSQSMVEIFYNGFSDKEIEEFEDYLQRVFRNLASFEEQNTG